MERAEFKAIAIMMGWRVNENHTLEKHIHGHEIVFILITTGVILSMVRKNHFSPSIDISNTVSTISYTKAFEYLLNDFNFNTKEQPTP